MSKRQFILGMMLSSVLGGLVVLVGLTLVDSGSNPSPTITRTSGTATTQFDEISDEPRKYVVPEGINFVKASNEVVPAVVHITNRTKVSGRSNSWNRLFRGDRRYRQSTGSGVIISEDGYIATNYHVVEDADELEVRLDDNRRIPAELIGVDPDTDLALIKVNVESMPHVSFGNSDNVQIGEWVLAVGNPFDLNNTVTAGIVSAKARNINIISQENRYGIESFIQTDAVVNRGNSGGALVNLDGELIGINTAIATNTGTFNGYSFAVPSILVKKVMDDLLEFGEVRRGLLGVTITDADGRFSDELSGVLITGVNPNGAADNAGLKEGDVIVGIGKREVRTTSELQELVARNRPGDDVQIKFKREGDLQESTLTLMTKAGATTNPRPEVIAREDVMSYEIEGARFQNVSQELLDELNLDGGAQIVRLGRGVWRQAGIKDDFIITKIGDEEVQNVEELQKIVEAKDKDFYVLGKYPNGEKEYYRINW